MNNNRLFNILVAGALKEKPPQVDISEKVIATLAAPNRRLGWIWDKPLMWIAAVSSVATVPFVTLAVFLHNIWTGPLFEISKAISWVM
ncbi:MAG: hypothetical protein JW715_00800 [Sedimentisphaerales bacterium]|nr:hypothetical protein [Sedimentisphaerales bacterium]